VTIETDAKTPTAICHPVLFERSDKYSCTLEDGQYICTAGKSGTSSDEGSLPIVGIVPAVGYHPRVNNAKADQESRETHVSLEWMLNKVVFHKMS